MAETSQRPAVGKLAQRERVGAFALGVALLLLALLIAIRPPGRKVALPGCTSARAGCVVTVDGDLTTLAVAVLAGALIAMLIAIVGLRITSLKLGAAEANFQNDTAGLPDVGRQIGPKELPDVGIQIDTKGLPDGGTQIATEGLPDVGGQSAEEQGQLAELPLRVTIERGMGRPNAGVPVPVTRLATPMRNVPPEILRSYQSGRNRSQHRYFLTHVLGPATSPGQRYSVGIRVSPRRDAKEAVVSADFYLGRAWGHRIFQGQKGVDGRFGITTEAYGAFLVLCEVTFANGERILLDHYCDFDMGNLLEAR